MIAPMTEPTRPAADNASVPPKMRAASVRRRTTPRCQDHRSEPPIRIRTWHERASDEPCDQPDDREDNHPQRSMQTPPF